MANLINFKELHRIGDDVMRLLIDNYKLSTFEAYVVIAEVQAFLQSKMTEKYMHVKALNYIKNLKEEK